jgi:hypothetical protein
MCDGDADLATEILKTETETGITQFHRCDECGRYCYTGGTLYPDGFTCTDCDDDVSDDDEKDECEICSGRFCIDEMELWVMGGGVLVCTECYEKELAKYEKELAKKNEPINAATLKMYRFCAEGEFDEHPEFDSTADDVREFWQDVLRYNSECYDEAWFSLIATPAIEKTINWHFIVTKYREARCIKEKEWNAPLPPRNPAKDAHFALCAERMAAGEITCDEAIALHQAAFPSDD